MGIPVSIQNSLAATNAVEIDSVSYRYGDKLALDRLSFAIESQRIFGVLGPNGSGKSTLFRLISTLSALRDGTIRVFGCCTKTETAAVRSLLGVVFQSPSLDRKLTVIENLRCQAALYGLSGTARNQRIDEVCSLLGISDRLKDRCEKLSGGLKRRVELAKGLLHKPKLLLMDEPSTGLDPAARLDLWHAITSLKQDYGTTIVLTTHLLEEADKCDTIAIMNAGSLVALDAPDRLRAEGGETIITITTNAPNDVASKIRDRLSIEPQVTTTEVRLRIPDANQYINQIMDVSQSMATSITIGRPSLEDVFIAKTGHEFHGA